MRFRRTVQAAARNGIILLFAAFSASGCTAPAPQPISASSTVSLPTPVMVTALPTSTATITPTPSPTATVVPQYISEICSPLEGLSLNDLPGLVTNPFATPHPGLDDGHHGTDFAYWRHGDRTTMKGLPIYAALPGRVAAAITDRPPYGNFIIIETPLEQLSANWQQALSLPSAQPTLPSSEAMLCPTPESPAQWLSSNNTRSLYILYAHMDQPPTMNVGSSVACGDSIGVVGTTGMSVNDHLHFEVRVGPSGASFDEMAFYDTGATGEEMSNYCTWRVSLAFQLVDPMKLISFSGLENTP